VVFLIPGGPAFVLLEANASAPPKQVQQASESNKRTTSDAEKQPPAEAAKRSRTAESVSVAASDALAERYEAGMVLAAAGDALGYRNGIWEFLKDGNAIHRQLSELGGLDALTLCLPDFRVSDDTILHLATAEALIEPHPSREKLYLDLARRYVSAMNDMAGRAPGVMTMSSCSLLKPDCARWRDVIPFNAKAGGCGSAIRSMSYRRSEYLHAVDSPSQQCASECAMLVQISAMN
jgi:ADP-ribosylglycohydrolase